MSTNICSMLSSSRQMRCKNFGIACYIACLQFDAGSLSFSFVLAQDLPGSCCCELSGRAMLLANTQDAASLPIPSALGGKGLGNVQASDLTVTHRVEMKSQKIAISRRNELGSD